MNSLDHPAITIIVVTYNSEKFLPDLFRSLAAQTLKDFRIIAVDNHSFDGSVKFIRENYPRVSVLENRQNLGFCKGNNQGIKLSKSEYIMLCNPDIVMTPDFVEKLYKKISTDSSIGCIGGKLLKYVDPESGLTNEAKMNIIDSTGLQAFKSCRFIDRGESDDDRGQYNKEEEVIGFSGAMVLFRRTLLDDIAVEGEYLDEDFIAYKDDADLAWRLQFRGHKALYYPDAVAFHRRAISRRTGLGRKATMINRTQKPKWANRMSYRNHFLLLAKNLPLTDFLRHSPWIVFYELQKFFFILLREPGTLTALFDFFRQLPKILHKRKIIMSRRTISSKALNHWFR